ncbi:MAG: nucleotide exchange factor GrpE, partial [Desulfobulbaceae bacterium]|nr:nucleotide exchange factor GrpE [Desulfobulbaceae bacterium]
ERHMDLFSLHGELTALKNEVRIESRQVKGALDDFRSVFTTLESANKAMTDKLAGEREEKEAIEALTRRPLIMGLLDIHDRIDAGLHALAEPPSFSFFSFFCRRQNATLKGFQEGQTMVLARILDLLASYGITPIDVAGEQFDPITRRAVSTVRDRDKPTNEIIEEIRKGFMQDATVLRLAEVRVNKL